MGLKYLVIHVVNRCGLVVPFVEHHRFKVILKGPRIFGKVNEQWFQLKSPAASVS